jgi:hypothetical protein
MTNKPPEANNEVTSWGVLKRSMEMQWNGSGIAGKLLIVTWILSIVGSGLLVGAVAAS